MSNFPNSFLQLKFWKTMAFAGLVLALLWAQTLGLVHRISHAQVMGQTFNQVVLDQIKVVSAKGHSGLFAHFDAPSGALTTDCRFLDQLSHSECFPTALSIDIAFEAPGFFIFFQGLIEQQATPDFFEARGPPLTV